MDLQTVTVEEIASLPGVGAKRAKSIYQIQNKHVITMKRLLDATPLPAKDFHTMVANGRIKQVPDEDVDRQNKRRVVTRQ